MCGLDRLLAISQGAQTNETQARESLQDSNIAIRSHDL